MTTHQIRRKPHPEDELTDALIVGEVEPGSRVIDLGCGDGRLLARLRDEKGCAIQGVELNPRRIVGAIDRGVPVVQEDLDRGLPDVPNDAFDVAVLSMTLQQVHLPKEVLREMSRVARLSIVVVPNFGHWRVRVQVLRNGRAPMTKHLPYEWYETPNLHYMSMTDFRELVGKLDVRIKKELPLVHHQAMERAWLANLRAHSALYVLERKDG